MSEKRLLVWLPVVIAIAVSPVAVVWSLWTWLDQSIDNALRQMSEGVELQ